MSRYQEIAVEKFSEGPIGRVPLADYFEPMGFEPANLKFDYVYYRLSSDSVFESVFVSYDQHNQELEAGVGIGLDNHFYRCYADTRLPTLEDLRSKGLANARKVQEVKKLLERTIDDVEPTLEELRSEKLNEIMSVASTALSSVQQYLNHFDRFACTASSYNDFYPERVKIDAHRYANGENIGYRKPLREVFEWCFATILQNSETIEGKRCWHGLPVQRRYDDEGRWILSADDSLELEEKYVQNNNELMSRFSLLLTKVLYSPDRRYDDLVIESVKRMTGR